MTTVQEEAREGSSLAVPASPGINAQVRAGARESLTPAAPLPSQLPSTAVTQRVRQAGEVAAKAVALLDKPGTLVHSQPPTFRQAHDRHRECADWFGTPVMKCLRRGWGWFHLLVILPPLYLAAWVTESPLRLLVAAALIAAIWFFS